MILQELFEASTFRKRSTSEMTFGFEFEVIVDDIEEDYDDIFERLMEEYPLEEYVNENINDFNFEHYEPKYGFASKEDIAEYNSQKNPEEKKLVKEILNLKDDIYKIYYFEILSKINDKLKIDNISDFDTYLNKKYSSSTSEESFKFIKKNMKNKDTNKVIQNFISKIFLYFSDFISNSKTFNYIYDEDNNILNLRNIDLSQIEELFEDSDSIIDEIEQDYYDEISIKASKKVDDSQDIEKHVENLLEKSDITNVKVINDESLGDDGVEIVTDKINGIDEAISQFNKITSLIQNEDELYTNERTGLHVNIGTWKDISQLDLTKLLVFSNETQILTNMDRQDNEYTKSLVETLTDFLQDQKNLQNYYKIIKDMNEKLLDNANHTSFMDFEKLKYDGYIEIRGFGNEDYEYKSDYIIKMIRYLSRIMEIASDPEEAKQQYIKKLYKIFNFDTYLSGEKQEKKPESILTPTEIKYITRFFSNSDERNLIASSLKSNNPYVVFNSFIIFLVDYDEELTNNDLRILDKLFRNVVVPKKYYENNIKGKSEKIDNLIQKFY